MYRNKKTLTTQSLTIPDFSSQIDRDQESWCLENFNQESISSHHLELDQYQIIDKLASFHFNEIKLEYEWELDLQFCDSAPNLESLLTLVTLPDLDPIFKSALITISIDLEHEPPIFSHIPL